MQQLQLFQTPVEKKIERWNLCFSYQQVEENSFVAKLSVPSGKFICKFSLYDNKKISSFEITDYLGYLYINLQLIKNIKNLVQAILIK